MIIKTSVIIKRVEGFSNLYIETKVYYFCGVPIIKTQNQYEYNQKGE